MMLVAISFKLTMSVFETWELALEASKTITTSRGLDNALLYHCLSMCEVCVCVCGCGCGCGCGCVWVWVHVKSVDRNNYQPLYKYELYTRCTLKPLQVNECVSIVWGEGSE